MATLAELETALRNADASGATDDARALAAEITRLKQGPITLGDVGAQAWSDVKKAGTGILNSIVSGATLAGDVVSGKAKLPSRDGGIPGSVPYGDPESAGLRMADLATLIAPVNPAVRIGDRAIPGVSKAVRGEKAVPTATMLDDAADVNYSRARSSGVEFGPDFVKNGAFSIQQELEQRGFVDAPKVASATHELLRRLQSPPAEPGAATSVTIANLDAARRSLRAIAQNKSPDNASDAAAASIAIDRLDALPRAAGPQDIVAGGIALPYAIEQIEKGRGNVAAAKRSNTLTGELDTAHTGVLERSQDRANAANSGANTGNAIRQRMASLLANKKQISGWSPEEVAQAELINRGTAGMNASRVTGNVLGGGGGAGAAMYGLAGASTAVGSGNPYLAAISALPVVGAGMKGIENALTRRQTNALDEMLRKRSPLYEDTSPTYTPVSPEKRAAIARLLAMQANQQ